jgi:hypothetical protein
VNEIPSLRRQGSKQARQIQHRGLSYTGFHNPARETDRLGYLLCHVITETDPRHRTDASDNHCWYLKLSNLGGNLDSLCCSGV